MKLIDRVGKERQVLKDGKLPLNEGFKSATLYRIR
jgi:hypothetical protein